MVSMARVKDAPTVHALMLHVVVAHEPCPLFASWGVRRCNNFMSVDRVLELIDAKSRPHNRRSGGRIDGRIDGRDYAFAGGRQCSTRR
jgi:hypothetical protein